MAVAITLVLLDLLLGRRLRQLLGLFLMVMVVLLLVSLVGPLTRAIPRQSGAPTVFSADSNVFMDLWPACRARLDRYLDNPAVTLYVHVHIYSEAMGDHNDRHGTQTPRLSRLQRPGALRVPEASPPPPDAAAMLSRNFGPVDLAVMETARVRSVPVLSTNPGLRNQVHSHPARAARYGAVPILEPCADVARPRRDP